MRSRRPPNAARHPNKPRVGAQTAIYRIDAQTEHVVGALIVTLAQPLGLSVLVSKADVDAGDIDGRDSLTRRLLLNLPKNLPRLALPTSHGIDISQPTQLQVAFW